MALGLVVMPGRGGHPILNRDNWFCIVMSHLDRFDPATIEILKIASEGKRCSDGTFYWQW
jgi:hypothetical protein